MFKSGLTVAFFTFISRIFGLFRELFIANLFGATSVADAVNVAFKLPNLFRRIFGEGALSIVFVPIFNSRMHESKTAAQKFVGETFILLLITVTILVALIEVFMPSLMFIIAPGFYEDKNKFDLTILLCRITLPYLVFISVSALFGAVLNSIGRFAAFAFVPILLNITIIIGTILLQSHISSAVSISLSIAIAGVLQVVFMTLALKRSKMLFPLVFNVKDKDVKKLVVNMGPATLSSGVQQLNLFLSQSIASFIPGAVSILSYADRIYQFPLSIIGITFGTILLPELSRIYRTNDVDLALKVQNKAIKSSLLLSLPATFGIIALSHPIIHVIYEHGAFSPEDTLKTAQTISAFAFGLPAFVLSKVLMTIFYANHDTATPLKITIYSLLANTLLNLLLMIPFDHVGIALGSSIAAWYNVWLLYKYANTYGRISISKSTQKFCLKVIISSSIMLLTIMVIYYNYNSHFYSECSIAKILALGGTIGIAIVMFSISAFALGLHKILIHN